MILACRGGFLVLSIGFCASIPTRADNIDYYVSARMRQLHIPGLSLAIVLAGRTTKSQGHRFANLELSVHATKETVYEIGSNAKQFSAGAIMILGSFVFSDNEEKRDGEIRRYKLTLGGEWYSFSVTTNKEGKVAQIYCW
jgi:Beta-lactamase